MAGDADAGSTSAVDLGADERAELERLRREVAALRARGEPPPQRRPTLGARMRLRSALATVLVVAASSLTLAGVVARYARAELLDTDRYVETVTPLAEDPGVQATITDQVTQATFTNLDVEEITREALDTLAERGVPPAVVGLASPIADQVESFTRDRVREFVATDEFAELWVRANRFAHERLRAVLTGQTEGTVDVEQGRVTVDLGEVVAAVKQRLVDRGFDLAERVPEVDTQLTVLESRSLERTQDAVRWLDRAATLLPFVALAVAAGAVLVAPDRRRGLLVLAVGVTLAMVVLAGGLALALAWYQQNGAPHAMSAETAAGIARTVLAPLRTALRAVLALGLVVAAAASLAGPSSAARAARNSTTRTIAWVRDRAAGDRPPSSPEAWVAAHQTPLRVAVVATGSLVFALWAYPTAGVVATILAAVVAGLVVIELVGREEPTHQGPSTGSTAGTPGVE